MRRLAPDSMQLAAQQWISALLVGSVPAQALCDLGIVAGWLLRYSPGRAFARFGPHAQAAWRAWQAQPPTVRRQPRLFPPASAALTAAIATQAITLLAGDDQNAVIRIRPLLRHQPGHWPVRPAGLTPQQWRRLSGEARGRFLRALDPQLTAADRLRHSSGTPLARLPADSAERLAARARVIPQLLWPQWAIRLTPAERFLPGPFRSTIAACLLVPGNPARSIRQVITGLHAYRSSFAVGVVLRALAEQGHDSVLTAISYLAGYLDTCGSPIDYQRRREAVSPEPISKDAWEDLCYQAGAHPGEDRRLWHARRYLYQLLTGADLNDPRHVLAFRSVGDRSRYHEFADTFTTLLRAALHAHAARYLADLGISEPLTWQPPADCCAHLTLPGRDPSDIDLAAVGQLAVTEGLPAGIVAERLGTSIGHIRLALERVPRPARQWGPGAAPVVWEWRQRADRMLTRAFFEREYLQADKTLRELEAETGFPRKFLAERARRHGIPLADAFDPAPIHPGWLREQYLRRKRSYTDIATELGVMDVTVIAAAHRHHIPSRPKGVHSRPEMIATLGPRIPRSIRRAVEGGLHGWLRLQRFQAAMAHPTVNATATHLGVDQATLIRQFARLERDLGGPLYHRSTLREPMRPTRRGIALLKALQRPGIAELMRHCAKAPAPPRRPRPPRTRTRSPSPREQSLAFYAAITARKIRITPAVRVTLQLLLDTTGEELYGEQIATRAGLRLGTIYQLLARLASAGWITSRKEDEQTCCDRNRHLPHYRLRIRRTYHTLTRDGRKAARHEVPPQPPAERSHRQPHSREAAMTSLRPWC